MRLIENMSVDFTYNSLAMQPSTKLNFPFCITMVSLFEGLSLTTSEWYCKTFADRLISIVLPSSTSAWGVYPIIRCCKPATITYSSTSMPNALIWNGWNGSHGNCSLPCYKRKPRQLLELLLFLKRPNCKSFPQFWRILMWVAKASIENGKLGRRMRRM